MPPSSSGMDPMMLMAMQSMMQPPPPPAPPPRAPTGSPSTYKNQSPSFVGGAGSPPPGPQQTGSKSLLGQ